MGHHDAALHEGYETSRRMQRQPRSDVLLRHAPASGRVVLPHTRSTATSARPIRSSTARAVSPLRITAARRLTRGRRNSRRERFDAADRPRARRRRCASPAPARRATALHALDADRLLAGAHPSWDELVAYMDGSAGSVGRMMAALLGVPARHHADLGRLGIAFQLANFIRDVPEDTSLDRIYLPEDYRDRFGVSERDLAATHAHAGGPRPARRTRSSVHAPVRGCPARRSPPRPRPSVPASASRSRSTAACSTASRRAASTSSAAAPASASGICPVPRWKRCDHHPQDPARRGADADRAPARRRADLRRQLRGARGRARAGRQRGGRAARRSLRDRRARPPRPARRRRHGCTRWASSARSAQEIPCMAFHHAARLGPLPAARGAGRASTTASSARRSG